MAYLIIAALINYIYHKSIGCMPFCYLYRRDPQAFALVVPAPRATVKPLPDIKVSKAKDEDLDSNKKILCRLLEENSDGQEATEQEYNKKDNYFIALSALIASNEDSNKNCDNISDIGDNSNWTLALGKSSNKEDEDFNNNSLLNLGTISIGNCNRFNKDYNLTNRL